MSKPDDIPQDVRKVAFDVAEPINPRTALHDIVAEKAACAIMAERERIASLAEDCAEVWAEPILATFARLLREGAHP